MKLNAVVFKLNTYILNSKILNKYKNGKKVEMGLVKCSVIAIGVTNFINDVSKSSLIRIGEDVNKKEIAYIMSYFKFRQRSEYKCIIKKGIEYRKVKEKYTSNMCSVCGS